MTIIGVAPEGFTGTTMTALPQIFVPISMRERLVAGFKGLDKRNNYWVYLFARLQPGATIEQAKAAVDVPYAAIVNDVEAGLQTDMSPATLARFKAKRVTVEPGARGQSNITRDAGPALTLLLAVTGFVLLIACANIANLLLARGAARASEMAVRLSIGASRWQVVRQLLTESALLAAIGGALGLVVARWSLTGIIALIPREDTSFMSDRLDPTTLMFTAAVAITTGLLFGLFPALHSTRPDLVSAIKSTAGQPSGARAASRFRTALATTQIALSTMLLILAGLFTKSLMNLSRVELGIIDRAAGDVRAVARSQRLHAGAIEGAVRAGRGRARRGAGRERRRRRAGAAAGRQQLGQRRLGAGLRRRTGHRHRARCTTRSAPVTSAPSACASSAAATSPAATSTAGPRWRLSTRRSRASST